MLKVVDHFPLAPGELFRDLSGRWYVRCPNCGVISNSQQIDDYFECPECSTIAQVDPLMMRQSDGTFPQVP